METEQGRWDLSVLYKGFDDPAFAADITRLEDLMAGYRRQVHEREGLDAAALAALLARLTPGTARPWTPWAVSRRYLAA